MKSNQAKGSFYAALSGLCYGLLGYFGINIIHANLSIVTMLFWRFLISSLFMAVFIVMRKKSISKKWQRMLKAFICGAVFYSITSIFYFIASIYIGTGLAMVIFFTYPAIIMICNWLFYRKPISKDYYAALALIVIGMVLLADLSALKCDMMGIGFAVLSAAFYAGYILLSKKIELSPVTSTCAVSLGCAMTCLMLALAHQSFMIPTTLCVWGNIVGMAVICTMLPILLLLESLKYIGEEKAALLSVLEPVFVVFCGVMLLGEAIGALEIIGVVAILSGALITLLYQGTDI